MLARWTVAFSFSTMAHLRKESDLERSLQARGRVLARVQRKFKAVWPPWRTCARSPTWSAACRRARAGGFELGAAGFSKQPGHHGAPALAARPGAQPARAPGLLRHVSRATGASARLQIERAFTLRDEGLHTALSWSMLLNRRRAWTLCPVRGVHTHSLVAAAARAPQWA